MADFDWVTARAKCSLWPIFEQLYSDLESDARRAGEMLGRGYSCRAMRPNNDLIVVMLEDHFGGSESVRFRLANSTITATRRDGSELVSATPTLSDDKQCRLLVAGKERELWQFRKLALEELFFRHEPGNMAKYDTAIDSGEQG